MAWHGNEHVATAALICASTPLITADLDIFELFKDDPGLPAAGPDVAAPRVVPLVKGPSPVCAAASCPRALPPLGGSVGRTPSAPMPVIASNRLPVALNLPWGLTNLTLPAPLLALAPPQQTSALLAGSDERSPQSTSVTPHAAGACPAPAVRRKRALSLTQEQYDDAVERVKQKRRESAQRSRQRKCAYINSLEVRLMRRAGWGSLSMFRGVGTSNDCPVVRRARTCWLRGMAILNLPQKLSCLGLRAGCFRHGR